MILRRISLWHVRNIAALEMDPSPRVNIIYGDNAQGKTNLLEAIWMGSGLRSFRGAGLSQLKSFDHPFGKIALSFDSFGRTQSLEIMLGQKKGEKFVKLGGVPKSSLSALSGVFPAVVFSPAHLDLVSGQPELRRLFIDQAIRQLRPHYGELLQKYQKCLIQRGHLLRKMAGKPHVDELLEVWNESLVAIGTAIMEYRALYSTPLRQKAIQYYSGISREKEKLDVQYIPSVPLAGGPFKMQEVSHRYRQMLLAATSEDIRLGYTSVGIHRDDWQIVISGKSAKMYGSQGQKRSAVLALKLAEADMVKDTIGEEPIILLDDVLSELDEKRQSYILHHLDDRQVFITCCDPSLAAAPLSQKIFYIHGGHIEREI